jgi:hypothetical protein
LFWAATQRTDALEEFWGGSEDGRSVGEICMAELASLANGVVSSGISGDAAVVSMARQLGLQRVRAGSRGRFERALVNATANAAGDAIDRGT